MQRTQIYLSEEQAEFLDARAKAEGRTRSDLIREAIDRYLEGGDLRSAENVREAIEGAFGIWADNSESVLRALAETRREFDAHVDETARKMRRKTKRA
jgi:predicted DNA-binding protein